MPPGSVVVHASEAGSGASARIEPAHSPGAGQAGDDQRQRPAQLGFVLQISRFRWDGDPARWLASVAGAAAEAGFEGIALMDHLIQIPQAGRAWEPVPEPWVTLGMPPCPVSPGPMTSSGSRRSWRHSADCYRARSGPRSRPRRPAR